MQFQNTNMQTNIAIVCIVIVAVIWLCLYAASNSTDSTNSTSSMYHENHIVEGYGIVGGKLGPYAKAMTECNTRCQRADPRSRLYPGTNIPCQSYCENLFTKKAKEYETQTKGSSPEEMEKQFESVGQICNRKCGVDTTALEDYSPSSVPPPFPLLPDNNILLPINNPGYVRTNLKRNQQRRCVDDCEGQYNVALWCKTLACPYSLMPEDVCMEQCIASKYTDNSQATWHWDINNR